MPETVPQRPCKILIDAMGGDFAPLNCVEGAVLAQKQLPGVEIYLIGDTPKVQEILKSNNLSFSESRLIHASEVIEMCDVPNDAVKRKKDSSIVVGLGKVRDKEMDAFVSAGNTGAMSFGSQVILGRIQGINRATMGTFFPNIAGVTTIFDVGSIVDAKPQHLLQFAQMGSIYVREIYGIEAPSVGLLNVGEEDSKGNELCLAAHKLLKESGLNFFGNIEGRDVLRGTTHVVVCDGFVGNIVLKFGEGFLPFMKHMMKTYAEKSLWNKIRIGMARGVLRDALKGIDANNTGGVPLLGVNGVSIIGHGSSSSLGICNMALRAKEMIDKKIVDKIRAAVQVAGDKK